MAYNNLNKYIHLKNSEKIFLYKNEKIYIYIFYFFKKIEVRIKYNYLLGFNNF